MKILNKLLGAGLLALVITLAVPQKTKAQAGDDEISFQTFYDELSPYGTWIDDPEYGDVWVPDVDSDFRPYATNGHWVITDYGNTWVSDYEWGWAPFHYGRWRFDDYYGWEWIPDYEWGPAWVDWQSADGYYGWAPLTPGISLDLAFGGGYTIPDNYWVFAPGAYITSPYIYNYYVPRTRIAGYIHRGSFIRNTYTYNNNRYITGPRPRDIQRFTHSRVNVYHINNASRPGTIRVQNNQVNIYRPRVQKAPDARPSRVVDAAAYRRANPNQRIANHGVGVAPVNHQNAQHLANFARTAPADNKIVRENNHNRRHEENNNSSDRNNNRPAGAGTPPGNPSYNRPARPEVPHTDGNPTPVTRPGQPQQNNDQQQQRRQQYEQRRQNQQRDAAGQQQREQQRQQQMQQRQQQQPVQQQGAQQQQAIQQREQQNQQRNAAEQQQREQQRRQQMQLRQQQQDQQQTQQRQQQAAQQRQQQEQQAAQQRQQQAAQQRQQQEQQRQQQAAQQRQQQEQQAAQQRQQQEQQRQQQAAQQRQQRQQQEQPQRQQQRPQRETRPERPQR